jgi:hypothetical protein
MYQVIFTWRHMTFGVLGFLGFIFSEVIPTGGVVSDTGDANRRRFA